MVPLVRNQMVVNTPPSRPEINRNVKYLREAQHRMRRILFRSQKLAQGEECPRSLQGHITSIATDVGFNTPLMSKNKRPHVQE